jgi:DNA-binding LytR/AlgR family response regulator
MKIRIVLVEENSVFRDELKNHLLFYNIFEIVGEFTKIDDVVCYMTLNKVDAVFANVKIGNERTSGDGFYLSVFLTLTYPDLMMVLYSDSEKCAYDAFKNGCTEFFVLPMDNLIMQRVVNRVQYLHKLLQYKNESVNRSIIIKTRVGYQVAKISDILFVERSNRRNKMVTVDGGEIILANYTMDEIEKMLADSSFYRCYQSFIVNLSKVSFVKVNNETKNYSLLFQDYDGEVMLSRYKYAEVISILQDKYAKIMM